MTKALPLDVKVQWKPDYRPMKPSFETGTVFTSDSRVTTVIVDGRPHMVATVALEVAPTREHDVRFERPAPGLHRATCSCGWVSQTTHYATALDRMAHAHKAAGAAQDGAL